MFVIRKEQLEVFRVPIRKKKRDNIFLSLQAIEGNKVYQEKDKIVVEDKKCRESILQFSKKNLLSAFTKPFGVQLKFEYDEEDRISKVEFPGQENLQLAYANDVPTHVILNGATIEIKYDSRPRINEIVFPDKKSVRFQYNELNQISAVINRAGATQTFQTFIENNRLVHRLKDELGRTMALRMDIFGGVEKIIFPNNATYEVLYDEILDAEKVKLRNGTQRTTYLDGPYPYRVEWEDGNYQKIEANDAQQLESIENQTGTVEYEYDDQQRPVSESFQDLKVTYNYEEEYLKSITYPSGLEVGYTYDEDDRLKIVNIAGLTVEYKYASNGTLAQIHYPNGLIEFQINQVLGGLKETKLTTKSGGVVSRQVYQYDILSRIVRHQKFDTYSDPQNWIFEYDEEDRLTKIDEDTINYHESFQYDPKGNIIQAGKDMVEVGVMDEVRRIGNKVIEYDRSGNITKFVDDKGKRLLLTYSDEGKLKFAMINDEVWEYWYDGLGRRVGKSNGKEVYKFIWAGEKLLSDEHKIGNNITLREYIYTDSNIPVAFKEAEEFYWLHRDVRGTITDVFDTHGNQVWKATYTAFGKINISIDVIRQPWRLAGQYYDEETGLHYNLARYFSPYLRTFLSVDPLWHQYGVSNYSYASNDPYNKIDIDGNNPIWVGGVIGGVVGGIVGGITTDGPWYKGVMRGAVEGAVIGATGGLGVRLAPSSPSGIYKLGGLIGGIMFGTASVSLFGDILNNRRICLACAKDAALEAGAWAAILGPLGKLIAPFASKVLPFNKLKFSNKKTAASQKAKPSTSSEKGIAPHKKMKGRSKPKETGKPSSREIQARDKDGNITKYTDYDANGNIIKEYRGTGVEHGNIPRPNVKEPKFHVNPKTGDKFQNGWTVRPPRPDEIPPKAK
ncbi:hypothetical protein BH23BAC1_BH23BAC1_25350 [soil metagenome]